MISGGFKNSVISVGLTMGTICVIGYINGNVFFLPLGVNGIKVKEV